MTSLIITLIAVILAGIAHYQLTQIKLDMQYMIEAIADDRMEIERETIDGQDYINIKIHDRVSP